MEWIDTHSVKGPTLTLDPYEAGILALVIRQPLKMYREELDNLNVLKMEDKLTPPQQQESYLILETIINIAGLFVDTVENDD